MSTRAPNIVFGLLLLIPIASLIWLIWMARPSTPVTLGEIKVEQQKDFLCRAAVACKKYSEARLACATAGNFQTCLRIKMGDAASFSGICSGNDEGAPAVPLPLQTPNAVDCFFRNLIH